MKIKISQSMIENDLMCPPGKSKIEFQDSEVPGLLLEVRSARPGIGTFYVVYWDAKDKKRYQKLGRTDSMDLAAARKQAKELKASITLGADPRGDEKARKAVMTLDVLFKDHYLPYAKLRKRSWKKDLEVYNLRLAKPFGNKRLNEITRAAVQSEHNGWRESGLAAATCNHPLKLLRHMLNLAVEWKFLDQNPVAKVKLFREDNTVENLLTPAQLSILMEVLETDPNRLICQIVMLLLSTGARLNEALKAKWTQIDRDQRLWRVPAENSKSKRVRSIPLNDTALWVLSQLSTDGIHEYLFINKRTRKPYSNIHKVWERLRKKAGVPFLRLHDCRHLHASWLVCNGRTLYEVQQILGHSNPSVTQRYAHLSTKTLQDASNSASIVMEQARAAPLAKVG